MITCPACHYTENRDDALVCSRCNTILSDTRISPIRQQTTLLSPEAAVIETRIREQHRTLDRSEVALYIAGVDEPLILNLTHDLQLGRYGGVTVDQPVSIDLAPFDALEMGVSRKHALLRRFGPDVAIVDLGSTNGTWLNGVQITPHQPVTLRSGDRIMLARLTLQIFLP
jgi:hypothetical protein